MALKAAPASESEPARRAKPSQSALPTLDETPPPPPPPMDEREAAVMRAAEEALEKRRAEEAAAREHNKRSVRHMTRLANTSKGGSATSIKACARDTRGRPRGVACRVGSFFKTRGPPHGSEWAVTLSRARAG